MARKGYPVPTRHKALELIALGYSDADVGSQVNVPECTIRRWRIDPRNAQILSACHRDLVDRLEENARLAVAHLRGVMVDDTEEPSRQMTAAIQSLKAHSKAVQAGAAKQIGEAVSQALSPDELAQRRREVLERLSAGNPMVLDAEDDSGD